MVDTTCQTSQTYQTFKCYLSGIYFQVIPPAGTAGNSGSLFCLHPLLSISEKDLISLTQSAIAEDSVQHIHLISWIVQLSYSGIITNLDNRLHQRFPQLGDDFNGFFVPRLMEIWNQINKNRTSSRYGNSAEGLPSLPKFSLAPANLADIASDSAIHERKELIKNSLVSWADNVRASLNISSLTNRTLSTHADQNMAERAAEKKLAAGKPKNLRALASYLAACLDRKVMDVEKRKAIESLYNVKETSLPQLRHLRQLVIDYGLTNYVDQRLAYNELLALCNKSIAERAGLAGLLDLSGSKSTSVSAPASSKSSKGIGIRVAPQFSILPAAKPEEVTVQNNRMLAALAARKAGSKFGSAE